MNFWTLQDLIHFNKIPDKSHRKILIASGVSNPGSMPSPGNQRWLWGSLSTSDKRVQVVIDPCWLLNPWAESSEVRNWGYHWPHKIDLGPTKAFFFKSLSYSSLLNNKNCLFKYLPFATAGSVMYEYGMRLAQEVPGRKGLQRQAKCYLAAMNSLRLVNENYAWIVKPVTTDTDMVSTSLMVRPHQAKAMFFFAFRSNLCKTQLKSDITFAQCGR